MIDTKTVTLKAAEVLPTATQAPIAVPGLDAAAKFTMTDKGIGYDDWNADFIVTFDKDLAAGDVTLKGQYDAYSPEWIDLPATDYTAGEGKGVMATLGAKISVAELAALDPAEFNCGVVNNKIGEDINVTVQLVISDGETTITIGEPFAATLPAVEPFDPEVPKTYETKEAAQKAAAIVNANKLTMINIPTVVPNKQAYVDLFEAVADGTKVTVQFTEDAKDEIAEELKNADAAATILTPDEEGKATLVAKPGLWYGIKAEGSFLDIPAAEGQNWAQAAGEEVKIVVPVVTDDEGVKAKAAFFQPTCSAKDPTK